MIKRTFIFILLNFGALAIGSHFTGSGVPSDWYAGLNKAPWTPPGWVFGTAWTTIMICFSLYMAYLWSDVGRRKTIFLLYSFQWLLNVAWNPAFFYLHQVTAALIIILFLTLLIGYMLFNFWSLLKAKSVLLIPYLAWLLIASSLNAYIVIKN